jgi:hypothetical protein
MLELCRLRRYNARMKLRPADIERVLVASLFGNVIGAFLFAVPFILQGLGASDAVRLLGMPSVLLAPLLVGFVASWFWRTVAPGIRDTLLYSLICTCVAFVVAVVVFREGLICLLLLAPLFYIAVLTGALVGRVWFNRGGGRANAYVFPLLFLMVLGEPALRGVHRGVVTDEIHIAAPPAKIWPHLLAFDNITEPPNYWLFHLGLPYPVRTTNAGNFVGADRACEFSGNAIFKERITEFESERLLTFDIVESPPDPELIGHLDAHRGQFELRDNHDGTTTLIGRTWYSLHVRPAFYFDWWTHDIFRAVHLRVMRHAKNLAETTQ